MATSPGAFRLGTWISLLLSGAVFGLIHLFNPDATWRGAIAIAVQAGVMLAASYVATRSLWVPIGLHFAWNFASAGIFSVSVSGTGDQEGPLDASTSGPILLGGGAFGPEASLYAVAAGLLVTVAFMWLAARRGRIYRRGHAAAGPTGPTSEFRDERAAPSAKRS